MKTVRNQRDITLTFNYDKLGRQRLLHNGDKKLMTWEYDSAAVPIGKGRLTSATKWVGDNGFVSSVDAYDVAATASYKPDGSIDDIGLPAASLRRPSPRVTRRPACLPSLWATRRTTPARPVTPTTAGCSSSPWAPPAPVSTAGSPTPTRRAPGAWNAPASTGRPSRLRTPTSTATTCAPSAGDATVGGPAPYRHSYTYDAAGNRAGEVRHATGTIGDAAITQATTYVPKAHDIKGGTHAHIVKSAEVRTATSGSSAKEVTAAQSFMYDEAGNTVMEEL